MTLARFHAGRVARDFVVPVRQLLQPCVEEAQHSQRLPNPDKAAVGFGKGQWDPAVQPAVRSGVGLRRAGEVERVEQRKDVAQVANDQCVGVEEDYMLIGRETGVGLDDRPRAFARTRSTPLPVSRVGKGVDS